MAKYIGTYTSRRTTKEVTSSVWTTAIWPSGASKSSLAIKGTLMKIVLLVVGPLFIALGLFWFGQGIGLLAGPDNVVLIDAGDSREISCRRNMLSFFGI